MKTEYWVLLAVVAFIFFTRKGMPFSGLTSQRGVFGTAGTPVDNSYD